MEFAKEKCVIAIMKGKKKVRNRTAVSENNQNSGRKGKLQVLENNESPHNQNKPK